MCLLFFNVTCQLQVPTNKISMSTKPSGTLVFTNMDPMIARDSGFFANIRIDFDNMTFVFSYAYSDIWKRYTPNGDISFQASGTIEFDQTQQIVTFLQAPMTVTEHTTSLLFTYPDKVKQDTFATVQYQLQNANQELVLHSANPAKPMEPKYWKN